MLTRGPRLAAAEAQRRMQRQLLAMLGCGGGNSSARLGRPKKERGERVSGPRGRKGLRAKTEEGREENSFSFFSKYIFQFYFQVEFEFDSNLGQI